MINKCKYIGDSEIRLIEQIACDLETGNHLLRPRTKEYWKYYNKMVEARNAESNTTADDKHEGEMLGNTNIYCVSLLNENYRMVYKPLYIELN